MPPETYTEGASAAKAEGDEAKASELLAQGMEDAKKTAQEVISKLEAGADFDALITEYNEDPGMEANPEGYLVYEGAPFVENFLNAALNLGKIGDYTKEPVETEYGYHVLLYASDPVAGPVPFEEVKDEIEKTIDPEQRTLYFEGKIKELKGAAKIEMSDFGKVEAE